MTPTLQPLSFLVGQWSGGGEVNDSGGHAHGVSIISIQADGKAMLRDDHNALYDKAGTQTGRFYQIMLIYPDTGGVRGDDVDGEGHVIHYGPATVVAGKSAEFVRSAPAGAPMFRLRYDAEGPDALKISFSIQPPGQTTFQPHRRRRGAPGKVRLFRRLAPPLIADTLSDRGLMRQCGWDCGAL